MSDDFWDTAAPLIGEGLLEEGTIMGGPCARATGASADRSQGHGEFVAMAHHKGPGMVVKLPRDRVAELIESGHGATFAPAKKVFKEWVLIEAFDEELWQALLRESISFVTKQ